MNSVAVASRSFSKNVVLREKLKSKYKNVVFNESGRSLSGSDLVNFLKGHDMAITALEKIDSELLSKLPELKVIGKYGVGLDMIDLLAMNQFGVKLGWTGGVNKRSVSELVIASAIHILHKAIYANQTVKDGQWNQIIGKQLSNCVFGIVGCGHIGKDLVNLLRPFGCDILVHDIKNYQDFYETNKITSVGIERLMTESDIISLHLPLDESTENIINGNRLKMMKQGSILINLARGGLVDEVTLAKLLREDKLAGAALDVFRQEPPGRNELIYLDNVFVTPHIGGSTEEAILAMGFAAIEGLSNAKDPLYFLDNYA